MRLLLDTHTALWFFEDDDRLSRTACSAILEPTNEKFVSIASAWELAIKISLGKLTFEGGAVHFLETAEDNGFAVLPILPEYIRRLEGLPYLHRDPFDRMLIATAMTEGMSLLTADQNIRQYELPVIW